MNRRTPMDCSGFKEAVAILSKEQVDFYRDYYLEELINLVQRCFYNSVT